MEHTPTPAYLKLTDLAIYASASRSTLKKWLGCGMPHYRIGRCIRVKLSEFDEWMREQRAAASPDDPDLDRAFYEAIKEAQS